MTREDILATTARIRDLNYFHEILTSDGLGAKRAWEGMEEMNFPNPLVLTSYLLENKDFFLRYCDDEGIRIRTAKTCMLMYAASLDGRAKEKDDKLTDIVDNKYRIYNCEWNDAAKGVAADAEAVLAELPFEEKVDFIEDVVSIFKAGGGITEKQQGLIDRLNNAFGIEEEIEDKNDTPMTEEEVLLALAEDPNAKDVHDLLTRDTVDGHLAKHFILSKEPKSTADLTALLDQVRKRFMPVEKIVVKEKPAKEVSKTTSKGWTCPQCGHTGNNGKFCEECGTKKPEVPETWTCPHCGQTGNKGKFCCECGTKKDQNEAKGQTSKSGINTTKVQPKGSNTQKPKENVLTTSVEFKKASFETYDASLVIWADAVIKHGAGKKCFLVAELSTEDGAQLSYSFKGKGFTPDVDQYQLNREDRMFLGSFLWFNLSPGGTYRFKVKLGVNLDGNYLPCPDFYDLKVEVKKTLLGVKYKIV